MPAGAWAQAGAGTPNWPSRPIRFISPSGAGLTNDVWSRILAQKLTERLGWLTVVENKPGGNYMIGTQAVLNAPADGHTVFSAVSSLPVVQLTMKNPPFDMRRDFIPLTRTVNVQLVLVANVAQPFKTAQELVAYARANPGKLSYGALNLGSLTHLAGELFKQTTGIDMVNVPYNGEMLMTDTMAGNVQVAVLTAGSASANIRAGRLRALAMLSPTRSAALPDVPTLVEAGLPAVDADGWQGLMVRTGTPAPIVQRLQDEIGIVIRSPEFVEKMRSLGSQPVAETSEQFRAKIESDLRTWGNLVASGKVTF